MMFKASNDIPEEPALSEPTAPALLLRHSPKVAVWALRSIRLQFSHQDQRGGAG